jgi:hypothetical protein
VPELKPKPKVQILKPYGQKANAKPEPKEKRRPFANYEPKRKVEPKPQPKTELESNYVNPYNKYGQKPSTSPKKLQPLLKPTSPRRKRSFAENVTLELEGVWKINGGPQELKIYDKISKLFVKNEMFFYLHSIDYRTENFFFLYSP